MDLGLVSAAHKPVRPTWSQSSKFMRSPFGSHCRQPYLQPRHAASADGARERRLLDRAPSCERWCIPRSRDAKRVTAVAPRERGEVASSAFAASSASHTPINPLGGGGSGGERQNGHSPRLRTWQAAHILWLLRLASGAANGCGVICSSFAGTMPKQMWQMCITSRPTWQPPATTRRSSRMCKSTPASEGDMENIMRRDKSAVSRTHTASEVSEIAL